MQCSCFCEMHQRLFLRRLHRIESLMSIILKSIISGFIQTIPKKYTQKKIRQKKHIAYELYEGSNWTENTVQQQNKGNPHSQHIKWLALVVVSSYCFQVTSICWDIACWSCFRYIIIITAVFVLFFVYFQCHSLFK